MLWQKKSMGLKLNPLKIIAVRIGKTAYDFYKEIEKVCDRRGLRYLKVKFNFYELFTILSRLPGESCRIRKLQVHRENRLSHNEDAFGPVAAEDNSTVRLLGFFLFKPDVQNFHCSTD